ncbi:DUF6173 family protein [uncultured Oscillibacter sp.]|jgi:hypothetical protein|uniref:DUF6173 family protein n=1 Tax=uncultured Oscillibacter sp. TaxID=876091 RepID=UPI00260B3EED|nr:DUF6173 family protein [uncultured Oscillibacter sp.]
MSEFSIEDTLKAIETAQYAPPPLEVISPRDYNLADYSYEVILERIKYFEDSLDDEHEVAVKLASFGQALTLSVTDIGYSNPSTLVFHGYVGDQPATLIQHMSQLNFLLVAVKKSDPEKPPRRIGFSVGQEEQ